MEEIFVNPECPFSVQTFDLLQGLCDHGWTPDGSHRQDFKENVEKPFQELCRQIAAQLPCQIVELINSPLLDEPVWDTNDWKIPQYSTENTNKSEQLFLQLDEQSLRFGFTIADESLRITVVFNSEEVLRSSAKQLSTQISQTFKHLFPLVLLATCDNPLSAIRDYLKPNYGINFPLLSPLSNKTKFQPKYDLPQCAENTGFAQDTLETWLRVIERKGQAILYGPPGTGKTFIAEQLAKHLIGGHNGFSELVQFHSAYSYEDFIQGIRPQSQDGELKYSLAPGRFIEFCEKAESREGLCVLIIDEINRANLAQVFGELMYLLEYRDKKIRLAGSSELFAIPENVRIIGTMNTADRSIALVDHALRRRFAFIEIRPNYDVLRRYHEKNETGFQVDGLIETLERLNKAIADKHYEIGISFFLTENLAKEIEDIWQMEIEPYLEEYFYDQLNKVDEFRWDKIKEQVCP